MAKFGQHEDLKAKLLNTGDSVIAEASPYDRIWGIGRGVSKAHLPWLGMNKLGALLMDTRTILRANL